MSVQTLDKSVGKIKFLFRIAGINIEDRAKTWLELARFIFYCIWITVETLLAGEWFVDGVSKGLDFMELVHVTPCLVLGVMSFFKSFCFVLHEKYVPHLLNNIRNLERTRLNNPHRQKVVKDETRFLVVLMNVMFVVNGFLLVVFNMAPLLVIAVTYCMTGELVLILPYLDIYPFDGYDIRFWPFVYAHQAGTACIVLVIIVGIDFLFYICCTHIKIQFKLLQHELEHLIPDHGLPGDELRERISDLVQWHQGIISSAILLERIYTMSMLFNYLSSSLIICLTGFNVTAVQDKTIVVTFATIAVVGMLQIYLLCFFGDMLMISSTEVSSAAYSCKWYFADPATRKSVHLMLTRSQIPCKLTAAGYADVNLKAFMKILSTSWSYFALLQKLLNTEPDE